MVILELVYVKINPGMSAHHNYSKGDGGKGFGAAVVEEHAPLCGDRVHRPLRVLDICI